MGTYSFFAVNDHKSVLWSLCADCLNDDEARDMAKTWTDAGVSVEVWDVERFVDNCVASQPLS